MQRKVFSFMIILVLIYGTGDAQSIQMRVCNKDGTVNVYNIDEIRKLTFSGVNGTDNRQLSTVVKNFNLLKNYPNPFNSSTTISYTLPGEGDVEIVIADLNGNIIQTFPGGNKSPGKHTLSWDGCTNNGKRAQPGLYLCKVKFNGQSQTNKMLLIK